MRANLHFHRLQACTRRRARRTAFTLVELLVVIGIIAVLISILLPTLRGVRRQANLVQCSSNMKQVATAMLMYINDNKGKFPACATPPVPGVYPNGWWWPNELVRQNYMKLPGLSVYKQPGSSTASKKFTRNNPYRCPEGIDEDSGLSGGGGDYPTHPGNNAFMIANDSQCAQQGFGIPSWYMLNSRNQSATNAAAPSAALGISSKGHRITPFMGFQSSANTAAFIKDPAWQRSMGMVRKSAELLMIVEASNINWFHQQDYSGKGNFLPRLGARHGKRTADGMNAWTNMAFFDGHVALYPSKPFQFPKDQMDNQVKEVIFYVNRQRGR